MTNWLRYKIRLVLAWVLNTAGIPGFVRDCDYEAGITKALITVRVRELFTIININGLEVYFHRLTGNIDGIGGAPQNLNWTQEDAEGSEVTMENETVLKHCPFCGNKPVLAPITNMRTLEDWAVSCEAEACKVGPITDFTKRMSKEEAIAAWNRRSE